MQDRNDFQSGTSDVEVSVTARSLGIFSYDSAVRRVLMRIVFSKWATGFVIFVILVNSICLALDDPTLPGVGGNVNLIAALNVLDDVFLAIFTFEMCLKIMALGVFFHGRSYLRDPWNVLDCFVVVAGLITSYVVPGVISNISALRVIRIFRPLRTVSQIQSLRVILSRLLNAVPRMRDVAVLLAFVTWVAAICGLQLFMGVLNSRCYADIRYYDNSSDVPLANVTSVSGAPSWTLVMNDTTVCSLDGSGYSCSSNGVTIPQMCRRDSVQYVRGVLSFDNLGTGLLLAFKIVTRDNWPDDLADLVNGYHSATFIFFLVITFFGGYFCLNLFVAVLTSSFDEVDDEAVNLTAPLKFSNLLGGAVVGNAALLVSHQMRGQRLGIETSLLLVVGEDEDADDVDPADSSCLAVLDRMTRRNGVTIVFRMILHPVYLSFTMLVVFVNAVVLSIDYYEAPFEITQVVGTVSFVCNIIFLVDCFLKMIGLGPSFVRSGWNLFDLFLCALSIPDLIDQSSNAYSALRAFRLVRLLLLAKAWRSLQNLIDLVIKSVKQVASLSFVGLIIIYVFAVSGYQLFHSRIRDQRFSFDTLFDSLLTVFVIITGENWASIMRGIMETSGMWAVLYFIPLYVIGNFVITNLFIAIIIDSFGDIEQEDDDDTGVEDEIWVDDAKGVVDTPRNDFVISGSDDDEGTIDHCEQQQPSPSGTSTVPLSHATTKGFRDIHRTAASSSVSRLNEPSDVIVLDPVYDSEDEDVHAMQATDLDDVEQLQRASRRKSRRSSVGQELLVPDQLRSNTSVLNRVIHSRAKASADRILSVLHVPDDDAHRQFLVKYASERGLRPVDVHIADDVELSLAARAELAQLQQVQRQRDAKDHASNVLTQLQHKKAKNVRTPANVAPTDPSFQSLGLVDHRKTGKRTATISEKEARQEDWQGLSHSAFFIIPPHNSIRVLSGKLLQHPVCHWTIVFITVASCIFLSIDNPHITSAQPWISDAVQISDYIFVACFVLELVLKVLALGVIGHPGAYFRSAWNVADFIVTVFSVVAIFEDKFSPVRALRVTRLATVNFNMKIVVRSLASAIPGMGSVFVLMMLIWWIFAVVGVALFKGVFYQCNDIERNKSDCNSSLVYNISVANIVGTTHQETPLLWFSPLPSSRFDNVGQAMYSLMKMSLSDGWFNLMYAAVDSPGVGQAPRRNASPVSALYFIVFMLIGNFFTVNLFVGVLASRFVTLRQRGEGFHLISPSQQQWVMAQKVLFRAHLPIVPSVPRFILRRWCFRMVESVWFDRTFTALILINSVILSADYYGMSSEYDQGMSIASTVIIVLFTLEAAAKLFAYGPRLYWRNKWNRLDVLVVLLSWVSVFVPTTGFVRLFRVARFFLLLRKMPGVQTLLICLYQAIPELANVGVFMIIVMFLFAVLGVALFSGVPQSGPLNSLVNFDTVGNALAALYICMTTEGWADISDAVGKSEFALPYFIVFMVALTFVIVNLFVTVVLGNFTDAEVAEGQESLFAVIESFREQWTSYDPSGTGKLDAGIVMRLLPLLPSSLWDRTVRTSAISPWLEYLWKLERFYIPVGKDLTVHYMDVVASIAFRMFCISIPDAISASQRASHGVTWDGRCFCLHHHFAAIKLTRRARQYVTSKRERRVLAQLRSIRAQQLIVSDVEYRPLRESHRELVQLTNWLLDQLSHPAAGGGAPAPPAFGKPPSVSGPDEDNEHPKRTRRAATGLIKRVNAPF